MVGKKRRVVCLVADGFGVGAAPDASTYGDEHSDTLGNTARAVGGLALPNLQKLGIGCLGNFPGIALTDAPLGRVTRLQERSAGKDTTTGHWELAGLVTREGFPLFPEGFPAALLEAFISAARVPGILGNCPASGTEIIKEHGEEHVRTGKPIVYTSGDSVFQIAAHEEAFGLERLMKVCQLARELTLPYRIGRVIARPFTGATAATFTRTEHRRDFSLEPGRNVLDVLVEGGVQVCSVGKIDDIFNHRSITRGNHTGNNRDGLEATLGFLKQARGENAFIFANLVDFDMLFGHRRDAKGYAGALQELDAFYPRLIEELQEDDLLLLTSDHGCDPTFRGSDHTREYVPLVAYGPQLKAGHFADRTSMADLGATVLDAFSLSAKSLPDLGKSFLL